MLPQKEQRLLKHKLGGVSGFILGLLYTAVISGLMGTVIYGGLLFFKVFAFSLLVYGSVYLISLSRSAGKIILMILGIAILMAVILCLINESFSEAVTDVFEGIMRLWQRISIGRPVDFDESYYDEISLAVLTLAASVAVLFLLNRYNSFYILSGVVASFFIIAWFITFSESRLLFALFMILTVLGYIGKVYRQKSKLGLVPDDLPLGSMMIYTIPVVFLPGLL
jgi:hypothetical protein